MNSVHFYVYFLSVLQVIFNANSDKCNDIAIEDSKNVTEDAFEDAAESIKEGGDALDEKAQNMGGGYQKTSLRLIVV